MSKNQLSAACLACLAACFFLICFSVGLNNITLFGIACAFLFTALVLAYIEAITPNTQDDEKGR